MPRNMSFFHTVEQIRDRTKTVTRRLGWRTLKPGERFWAVKKAMGLKPGEKIERLALLECVSNQREHLTSLTKEDVAKEGFPGMSKRDFVVLFFRINPAMTWRTKISRIEFKYMEDSDG